jgi:hypothetical protein
MNFAAEKRRQMIIGGLLGVLVAGSLAIPSVLPPAMAEEEPMATLLKTGEVLFAEPLDAHGLFKPPQRLEVEDSVSTEVLSQHTVRKIAYGKTTFVDIFTTPTGTYSSDGLASNHIRYPGINISEEWKAWQRHRTIATLDGGAWHSLRLLDANSAVRSMPIEGGRLTVHEEGNICVEIRGALYC